MEKPLLASSDRLYRWLLRSYPPAFRVRFAAEMSQVFRTLCRATYRQSGASGLAWLWVTALWDWAWAAITQWWHYLLKWRTEMTQTNLFDRRDGVKPLSAAQAAIAALPFLAFGISSLVSKLNFFPIPPGLPLWQVLIIHPFLVFNWLILIGLGISLLKGFPRWGISYLGWAILFGWWWSDMRFYGYEIGGLIWLPLLGVILLALVLRRSIQPMRNLLSDLWKEWTILSFALYILYSYLFMLYDENHNPYLLLLMVATTLCVSLGAWGYFRAASPMRRVLALVGGFLLVMIVSAIDSATWDFRAYYNLPESGHNVSLVGYIFFIILALLMSGNGLLAYWRAKRQDRVAPPPV
jgi:hypothetical protein